VSHKQRVLAVEDDHLQGALDDVVIQRRSGHSEYPGQTFPMLEHALGAMMLSTGDGFGVEDSDTSSWKNNVATTASCVHRTDFVIFASI